VFLHISFNIVSFTYGFVVVVVFVVAVIVYLCIGKHILCYVLLCSISKTSYA